MTTDTLDACTDCVMLVANDEVTDGDGNNVTAEHAAKVIAYLGIPRVLTYLALACEPDCEGWFSWSRCDVCGDWLGGDRHPMVLNTEEVVPA